MINLLTFVRSDTHDSIPVLLNIKSKEDIENYPEFRQYMGLSEWETLDTIRRNPDFGLWVVLVGPNTNLERNWVVPKSDTCIELSYIILTDKIAPYIADIRMLQANYPSGRTRQYADKQKLYRSFTGIYHIKDASLKVLLESVRLAPEKYIDTGIIDSYDLETYLNGVFQEFKKEYPEIFDANNYYKIGLSRYIPALSESPDLVVVFTFMAITVTREKISASSRFTQREIMDDDVQALGEKLKIMFDKFVDKYKSVNKGMPLIKE